MNKLPKDTKRKKVPTLRIDSDQRVKKNKEKYTYYAAPDLSQDEIDAILAKES